jgi:hypothetical protein
LPKNFIAFQISYHTGSAPSLVFASLLFQFTKIKSRVALTLMQLRPAQAPDFVYNHSR